MQAVDIDQIIANNVRVHVYAMHPNARLAEPVLRAHFPDGHGATGPLVFIGFLAEAPVYRTAHTVAHYMKGDVPGELQIHWPPLFLCVWLPECDYMQLDVTIRLRIAPAPIPVPAPIQAGDSDDDDDGFDDLDLFDQIEEEEEVEITLSCLDKVDIQWVNFHRYHQH